MILILLFLRIEWVPLVHTEVNKHEKDGIINFLEEP